MVLIKGRRCRRHHAKKYYLKSPKSALYYSVLYIENPKIKGTFGTFGFCLLKIISLKK